MPTKYKVNLHNIIKFQVAGEKSLDNYDIAGTEQTEKKERKSDKNLLQNQDEKNGYNGEISKRTKAKIQTLMQNWLLAGKVADKNGYKQKKGNTKITATFCTVTLPKAQAHTDQELRRRALNGLLQALKRYVGMKNYIYVSELQKNGNIHFHIIIDVKLNKWKLRNLWRKQMYLLGYLDTYSKHEAGQKYIATQADQINDVTKVGKYISKYMAKTNSVVQQGKKLEGRLWGMSDGVREYQGVVMDWKEAKQTGIVKIWEGQESGFVVNEYVEVRNYDWEIEQDNPIIDILLSVFVRQYLSSDSE
jgi:hypothetical protein